MSFQAKFMAVEVLATKKERSGFSSRAADARLGKPLRAAETILHAGAQFSSKPNSQIFHFFSFFGEQHRQAELNYIGALYFKC